MLRLVLMNNKSLREHLAEKVMGFRVERHGKLERYHNGYDVKNLVRIEISDWLPDENIEQAIMCLGTLSGYSINKVSMAISLTCARATEWEE